MNPLQGNPFPKALPNGKGVSNDSVNWREIAKARLEEM